MAVRVEAHHSWLALNTASLQAAALAYAQHGLPVFPLRPRSKEPLVPTGFYAATTECSRITHWWSRWPRANIGLATGIPGGWWVLDIDPRHGGLGSVAALERHARDWGASHPISETLRQLTGGGGIHLCYQRPAASLDPSMGRFAGYQGIDFKKSGGYIVVAPSIHPGGSAYQWQQDVPPAPFPQALLAVLSEYQSRQFSRASAPAADQHRWRQARARGEQGDREAAPEYWLHCALRHAAPGCRHNYALFLAIKLVRVVGCTHAEAASWMREYVAHVPQAGSPYEFADALECLDYAWRDYGPPG